MDWVSLAEMDSVMEREERVCVKCKSRPGTLDIRFAVYCAECFKEATHHKFRSGLARCWPARTRPAALVLVQTTEEATHLTPASRVLLHFTQLPGMEEPQRRNLTQWRLVLPISFKKDIGAALRLARELKTFYNDLECIYLLPLASAFIPTKNRPIYQVSVDNDVALASALEALPWERVVCSGASLTVQEDLAGILFRRLLLGLMAGSQVSRCLMAESSTACAIAAIASVSKGRGRAVPFQSAYAMDFPEGLQILKPMRDISDLEISLYIQTAVSDGTLKGSRVEESGSTDELTSTDESIDRLTSTDESIDRLTSTDESIDRLTASFISGLEDDFPGTSSTVLRTIDKIHQQQQNSAASTNDLRCQMCLEPTSRTADQEARTCEPCLRVLEESRLTLDSLSLYFSSTLQ